MDSIDGKITQLTNNIQEFWHTLIDSELVKDVVDFLSSVVQFVTDLIKDGSKLPAIIANIVAALNIKNILGIDSGGILTAIKESIAVIKNYKNLLSPDQANQLIGLGVDDVFDVDKTTKTTTGISKLVKEIAVASKETGVFKAIWAKLVGAISAHPFIAVGVGVAALIGGIFALNDALTTSADEVQETYKEFQELESEIKSLNDELTTTKERIAELSTKQNLSLADAEELEKLKETNRQLEIEIRNRETLAKQKGKDANDKAVKYFEQDTSVIYNGKHLFDGNRIDALEYQLGVIADLEEYFKNYTGDSEKDVIYSLNKQQLESFKEQVSDTLEDFMETDDALIEGMDNGLLEILKNTYNLFDITFHNVAQSYTDTIEGAFKKVGFEGIKDRLINLEKDGKLSTDVLQTQFKDFTNVLLAANVPLESIVEYIKYLANPDAINYKDVQNQLFNTLAPKDSSRSRTISELFASAGLDVNDEKVLDAFIAVRAKNGDGTDLWNPEDWIKNIQDELNAEEPEINVKVGLGIKDSIESLNTKLKPVMDSIASAWGEIFTDNGFALKDIDLLSVASSIKTELDELKKEHNVDVDYSAYEDFVEVLEDSESTEKDVKKAFDALAQSIVDVTVTGIEDFETLKDSLEDLGIVNNEIIAFQALAKNVKALKAAELDLSTATEEQIADFAKQYVSAENLSQAIQILTYQKMLYNISEMDTSEEVSEMHKLAESIGASAVALNYLTKLERAYQLLAEGGLDTVHREVLEKRIQTFTQKLQEELSNAANASYDAEVKYTPKIDSDDIKKAIDSYMVYMEAALDAGEIDFKTYSSKVSIYLKDMFNKGKLSAKEYHEYTKQLLEKQKDIYDKALSAIETVLDKEIDKYQDLIDEIEKQNEALEKQLEIYDSAISAIQKFLDTEKEKYQDQIDDIEAENDSIQDQIDKYDDLLNAVTLVFNEKRDALQAEQDAIDERIESLQEENDEYQKAIELEKAKAALEKARNQRTKYLYSGEERGFVYQTDYESIADAEKTLSDLNFNATIDALEEEKQLLQDIIDQLNETEESWQKISSAFDENKSKSAAQDIFGDDYANIIINGDPEMIASIMNEYTSAQQQMESNETLIESINDKISNLDRLSEKWDEIATTYEDSVNRENAALLLGKEWQQIVLEDRQIDYDEFKNNYLAIQAQINDNTALIESYNEKIEYYEKLKEEYSSITTLYEEEENKRYAAMLLGQSWEKDVLDDRLEKLSTFRDEYVAIQKEMEEAALAAAKAAAEIDAANIASGGVGGSGGKVVADPVDDPVVEQPKKTEVQTYATEEAKNAAEDALSAQEELFDRWNKIFDDEYDEYHVGTGKKSNMTFQKFGNGGVVSSTSQNAVAKSFGEDIVVMAKDGERILTPVQNGWWEKWTNTIPDLLALSDALKVKVPNFSHLNDISKNNARTVTVQFGDIVMHGVQDVDGLAKQIRTRMPGIVTQMINKQ